MFGLGTPELLIIVVVIGGGIYLIFKFGKLSGENKALKEKFNQDNSTLPPPPPIKSPSSPKSIEEKKFKTVHKAIAGFTILFSLILTIVIFIGWSQIKPDKTGFQIGSAEVTIENTHSENSMGAKGLLLVGIFLFANLVLAIWSTINHNKTGLFVSFSIVFVLAVPSLVLVVGGGSAAAPFVYTLF